MLELITGEAPPNASQLEVDVGFVGPDGTQIRMGLADVAAMKFELATPVRAFPSYKRQRYFPVDGGAPRLAGTWARSRGLNATI
ncbi:MAG TPA: hypothetical protein VLL08_25840 [Kineosporiaceae bacterium]|nr:hypothetical protein [Kineosporiaceae bacterium]